MKLTAKEIPYSSIVGASLALVDDKGAPQLTIMFGGTSKGISQEQNEALCRRIGQLINEHGLAVPPHEEKQNLEHDLYKTGDRDAPEQIKDRNGEVALQMCRVCGHGEVGLGPYCPGPPKAPDEGAWMGPIRRGNRKDPI